MSQSQANRSSPKSARQQKSSRPWRERAGNKRQKKRIVQGEAACASKRSDKQRQTIIKRRMERPIPAMSSLGMSTE